MKIKVANMEELDLIVPLFNAYRCFYDQESNLPEAKSFLLNRMENKESIIFIALIDEKCVGFTQLYPTFSSVALKRAFILNDLYVDENFRRHGVAQQLMQVAFQYAEKNEARFITLQTSSSNVKAQALYEKMGMVNDDTVKHYVLYW